MNGILSVKKLAACGVFVGGMGFKALGFGAGVAHADDGLTPAQTDNDPVVYEDPIPQESASDVNSMVVGSQVNASHPRRSRRTRRLRRTAATEP